MTETKLPEWLKKGIEQYKCIEHNKYSEKCHVCLNYSFIEVGLVRAWELTQERIERLIRKHKSEHDIDGFPVCNNVYNSEMTIAEKGKWLGTEEERKQAIKSLKKDKQQKQCDVCLLIDEVFK